MTSNQRSPLWPYLLVLGSLFALSLAVPHGGPDDSEGLKPDFRQTTDRPASYAKLAPTVAIARPNSETTGDSAGLSTTLDFGAAHQNAHLESVFPIHPSGEGVAGGDSLVERVAQKITSSRIFGVAQSFLMPSDPTTGPTPAANSWGDSGAAQNSNTTDSQFMQPPRSQYSLHPPAVRTQPAGDDFEATNCALPHSLLEQLDRVAKYPECVDWAAKVKDLCVELCRTSPGDGRRSADIVLQLQSLVPRADALADGLKDTPAAENLRRARYSLQRRLMVWSLVFSDELHSVYSNVVGGEQQRRRLGETLAAADSHIRTVPYADGWRNYLLLDDVARLTSADQRPSKEEARQIARHVIDRLSPRQISDAQRQVLIDPTFTALLDQLRPWAAETVDLREVLSSMEQFEDSGLPSDGRNFVAQIQRLNWSNNEKDRQLAQQLDLHYRNANIRVVLTSDLINRLIPDPQPAAGVVNDTILNARVSGSSETKADLQVKLVPDSSSLHVWVAAQGSVDSITQSTRGPATFNSRGEATFAVRKPVIFGFQGYTSENASAQANSHSELLGVQTTLDGKLLGSFARRYAATKEEALRGEAQHEVDQKVAAQAEERLNAEVDRRMKLVDSAVREQLLAPLAKLQLETQPITLETSAQRLTARLRLAGQTQVAGHTARPQASSDSLASLQVHKSAIDNMLDRLELAGRTFTLPELFQYVAERVSQPWEVPSDLPPDAAVTFTQNDPIRVRCEDGTVRLTLVISELRRGSRQWRDFVVTANYQPQIDGLHVRLVRSGVIELGGDAKGQSDILLRGIFSKLLPPERKIELIPALIADQRQLADLAITQCVIADGWIGLAMGPGRTDVGGSVAARAATIER